MSGTLPQPFSGFAGGNPLMPRRPAPIGPAPQQLPVSHHVRRALQGVGPDDMIRKRDNAGKEMAKLAEIASDPEPHRPDIVAYIGELTKKGQVTQDEAAQILQGLPQQPDAIRAWAKQLFQVVAHVGIQAHAAYPAAAFPAPTQGPVQPTPPVAAGTEESAEVADNER